MDKFHVQNYYEMSEKENDINPADYVYNESVRRNKKNYKTIIHVLEKKPGDEHYHLEGPPSIIDNITRKRSRIVLRPQTKPSLIESRSYCAREDQYGREIIDFPMSSKEVDSRSSHTNLSKLFQTSRKPHPPLTERVVENIQKGDSNHDEVMSTHINKMKDGIHRLQEITQKFNCTEDYKNDIQYLIKNVKTAIRNAESRPRFQD